MLNQEELQDIVRTKARTVLAGYEAKPEELLPALEGLQLVFGALDETLLTVISDAWNIPYAEVAETASFYSMLRTPAAPVAVPFNSDIAQLTEFHAELKAQTQLMAKYFHAAAPESVEAYRQRGGYTALKAVIAQPEQALEAVKASGLRGRSGSNFPTGIKWESVRKAGSNEKYIVCNGDEGEPGTGKDHVILMSAPHLVIEGMLSAAVCVGAHQGYIYIRGEYPEAVDVFQKALKGARGAGILGDTVLGSDYSFDIEVRVGAGAYLCGEETALLESIEGRRGEVRDKPPYPSDCGLWGKPTLVSNVETFATVPVILSLGADEYRRCGMPGCPGTKLVTVSGCVAKPGVYELPFGLKISQILALAGGAPRGKTVCAVQTGGGSGPIIRTEQFDTPFDVEHCGKAGAFFGTGALMFIDSETNLLSLCETAVSFFAAESCGRCVPCRIGLHRIVGLLRRIRAGEGLTEELKQTALDVKGASRCALGAAAVTPVVSLVENFPEVFRNTERREGV